MARNRILALLTAVCLVFAAASCDEPGNITPNELPSEASVASTVVTSDATESTEPVDSLPDPASSEADPTPSPTPDPTASPKPVSSDPTPTATPKPVSSSEPSETQGPAYSGKLTQEQLAAFSNAAFVGNSVMDGFNVYNIVPTADCYTRTSLSVFNINKKDYALTSGKNKGKTVMNAISESNSGKSYSEIYVLFGINETSYSLTKFIDNYAKVVKDLKAAQPNATIYVFSIFPVTKAKSDKNVSGLTNPRINEMNAELKKMCASNGAVYLDLHSKLKDSSGALPASNSSDGVHLKKNAYNYVAECIYDMVYA